MVFIFSSKCSLTQLKVPLDPLALFTTGKYKLEWKFAQIPMTTWFYLAIFFFIHSNRVVSSISSLSLSFSHSLYLFRTPLQCSLSLFAICDSNFHLGGNSFDVRQIPLFPYLLGAFPPFTCSFSKKTFLSVCDILLLAFLQHATFPNYSLKLKENIW